MNAAQPSANLLLAGQFATCLRERGGGAYPLYSECRLLVPWEAAVFKVRNVLGCCFFAFVPLIFAQAASAQGLVNGQPCNEFCAAFLGIGADEPSGQFQDDGRGRVPRRIALKGRVTRVNDYYAVLPDCRSRGPISVEIVKAPETGDVLVSRARGRPAFGARDPNAVCNRKNVEVTRVSYRADPEFDGEDSFTVRATFPSGAEIENTFVVSSR